MKRKKERKKEREKERKKWRKKDRSEEKERKKEMRRKKHSKVRWEGGAIEKGNSVVEKKRKKREFLTKGISVNAKQTNKQTKEGKKEKEKEPVAITDCKGEPTNAATNLAFMKRLIPKRRITYFELKNKTQNWNKRRKLSNKFDKKLETFWSNLSIVNFIFQKVLHSNSKKLKKNKHFVKFLLDVKCELNSSILEGNNLTQTFPSITS